MTIRTLLVDDHDGFRRSARELLERDGIAVVGVATTSAEALQQAERLRPDVALVNITLGAESGFDLARTLAHAGPEPPRVIMSSAYAEEDFTEMIMASPVIGFLPKTGLSGDAIHALVENAAY
jgi:DNA-binding NarL/FixJ family response regulator